MTTTNYHVSRRPIQSGDLGTNNWQALVNDSSEEIISIVSKDFRLIQNDEVFGEIDTRLKGSLEKSQYDSRIEREWVSKGGLWAKKEWLFPDVYVPSTDGSRSDISFRVIGVNSFGSGAIKCLFGGIDWYCLNGMVVGEQVGMIRKAHYGSFEMTDVIDPVAEAVEQFKIQGETWLEWQQRELTKKKVDDFLYQMFSLRVANKIAEQWKKEVVNRGATVWALYSAMTAYASHANQFNVSARAVNNRTTSQIMHTRELEVQNVIASTQWNDIAS